jgi:hypothetical protein
LCIIAPILLLLGLLLLLLLLLLCCLPLHRASFVRVKFGCPSSGDAADVHLIQPQQLP